MDHQTRTERTFQHQWVPELLAWAAIFALTVSCSSPDTLLDHSTETGESVRTLLRTDSTTVLLILEPSDCFECTRVLPEWLAGARRSDLRVKVLLTSPPSEKEQAQFTIRRIPISAVLSGYGPWAYPRIFVFEGFEIVDSATTTVGHDLLLAKWAPPDSTGE